MTNNIIVRKDQKLRLATHYKSLPKEGGGEEIFSRNPQVVDLKKGDIVNKDLFKKWNIMINESGNVIWVNEEMRDLPHWCLNSFRPTNRDVETKYVSIYTVSLTEWTKKTR